MISSIASPEPISRNIFEKYYQVIEHQKIKYESELELKSSLGYLERIVLAIEQSIQDILSDEEISTEGKEKVYFVTTNLLNNWLSVIICCEDDKLYIDALAYNFIPVLNILEKVNNNNIITTIRHIGKFNPILEFLNSRPLISKRIETIIKNLNGVQDIAVNTTKFINLLFEEYKKNTLVTTIDELNKVLWEDDSNKEYFKQIVLVEFASAMVERFLKDSLKIEQLFNVLKNEGVQEIREYVNKKDLFEIIERQFEFDDNKEDLIWNIIVKIDGEKFNAAEIGYLIWSTSKSLESIDDIEVDLIEWGEGSKWFHLEVRIKSLASKVDLADVFKTLRQGLESFYHKKPLDEIKKLEAEKDKLIAEANKIVKEEKNLMSAEQSHLKHNLLLHKDLLDIEYKEIENESKKADVRLKNLEYLKGLSSLMKDGIIQNNSNIQIIINDLIFFKKEDKQITIGDDELLDINERKKPKSDV